MRKIILLLLITAVSLTAIHAQFNIKIPKIKVPEITKNEQPPEVVENSSPTAGSDRRLVMDDGFTFFDAEPVSEYDSSISLNKDIGWYLRSNLRLLGTFPTRSAFKVVVRSDGKDVSTIRCEANIYTKSADSSLMTDMQRKGKDLNFEDFMYTDRCYDEESAIKEIGRLDVEIYFIDGDTDEQKLVRTYQIDVHRATRVRGSATNPQPDVSHYYIQRHAEAAVAFIHITGNHTPRDRNGGKSYFLNDPATGDSPYYGQLIAYLSYSPERSRKSIRSPYLRCTVNGQNLKLPRDSVSLSEVNKVDEYAVYTDRNGAEFKRGSAYRDDVRFRVLAAALPLYTGEAEYATTPFKIEDHPGDWECRIVSNGETYRTLRFTVGNNGEIARHAEQINGNVNLMYTTYLIDLEIPPGGSPMDFRLAPLPDDGLFYGIPWTSDEGRQMAARVPKKGNLFHVPSQ